MGLNTENKKFYNGDVLFEEGDVSDCLYIVSSGRIRIYKTMNGEEIKVNDIGKGEIIGTMSVIEGTKRTASAKALCPTTCKVLPVKNIFNVTASQVPLWYQAILKDVLDRFKTLEEKYLKVLEENKRYKGRY